MSPCYAAGQDAAASLQANRSAWLVVPPSLVSETGNDCDLVGTSFAAFRNQVVSTFSVRAHFGMSVSRLLAGGLAARVTALHVKQMMLLHAC